jgi:hypothetical protein
MQEAFHSDLWPEINANSYIESGDDYEMGRYENGKLYMYTEMGEERSAPSE